MSAADPDYPAQRRGFLPADPGRAVLVIRLLLAGGVLALWEALARSGLFPGEVVPSVLPIANGLFQLLADPAFYRNAQVTLLEVLASVLIGSAAGIALGVLLGANRFFGEAFQPFVYYLSPTPRIVFFPIAIMWFGVGPGSKVAMGAFSCFFAVCLSTAAGMREIDPVLIRVGRSFRANAWQMAMKIYLPAMRIPVWTGVRLGMGGAIIAVLLSETKLSNQGLGYLIMQIYQQFNMPKLYALLILVFCLAAVANVAMGAASRGAR